MTGSKPNYGRTQADKCLHHSALNQPLSSFAGIGAFRPFHLFPSVKRSQSAMNSKSLSCARGPGRQQSRPHERPHRRLHRQATALHTHVPQAHWIGKKIWGKLGFVPIKPRASNPDDYQCRDRRHWKVCIGVCAKIAAYAQGQPEPTTRRTACTLKRSS